MTTAGFGGSTPQFQQGGMVPGAKALFFSLREIALIKSKTIKPGFGVVYSGTVMATTTADNELVPYVPDTVAVTDQGRSFVTADIAIAATVVRVLLADSYRFAVGDTVIVADNTPTYVDCGAITAIDRTTYAGQAAITVTTSPTPTVGMTVADMVHMYHKAGTAGKFCTASFIGDQDVFTGEGSTALGANTSVVISNAILYAAALVGYDATAATALGAVADGNHIILK